MLFRVVSLCKAVNFLELFYERTTWAPDSDHLTRGYYFECYVTGVLIPLRPLITLRPHRSITSFSIIGWSQASYSKLSRNTQQSINLHFHRPQLPIVYPVTVTSYHFQTYHLPFGNLRFILYLLHIWQTLPMLGIRRPSSLQSDLWIKKASLSLCNMHTRTPNRSNASLSVSCMISWARIILLNLDLHYAVYR